MQNKVLAIEDSKTSMLVMKRLIERAGLEAITAYSMAEAKRLLEHHSADEFLCALVDYNLPDAQDGEAIDFVIEAYIPAIVITGRLDEETRDKIMKKEIVDYIPKENHQIYDYLTRLMTRLQKNKKIGVLVVDDSKTMRTLTCSLLERHNFQTYEAADGAQGLEVLSRYKNIKLVIVDENMPVMTGVDMVVEVRRKHSKENLAIIGVSGIDQSNVSARFLKSGANDYINKNYCHEEFFCRVVQNIENLENVEMIRRSANSDYLTGLPNRRHFFNRLESSLMITPDILSVAIVDIDHFKKINNKIGSAGGDKVLKDIAKQLAMRFSKFTLCRFADKQFCIFMPHVSNAKALAMLNKFREEVSLRPISFEQLQVKCSVSIGLSSEFNGDIHHTLQLAESNLMEAKKMGRNRVVNEANETVC